MTQIEVKADKISPNAGRVLVRLDSSESITKGGILIPENAKERTYTGEIVAVGPPWPTEHGFKIKPTEACRVGARCAVPARFIIGGSEIQWRGLPHVIVRWEDLLAFLEGDGEAVIAEDLDRALDAAPGLMHAQARA